MRRIVHVFRKSFKVKFEFPGTQGFLFFKSTVCPRVCQFYALIQVMCKIRVLYPFFNHVGLLIWRRVAHGRRATAMQISPSTGKRAFHKTLYKIAANHLYEKYQRWLGRQGDPWRTHPQLYCPFALFGNLIT